VITFNYAIWCQCVSVVSGVRVCQCFVDNYFQLLLIFGTSNIMVYMISIYLFILISDSAFLSAIFFCYIFDVSCA